MVFLSSRLRVGTSVAAVASDAPPLKSCLRRSGAEMGAAAQAEKKWRIQLEMPDSEQENERQGTCAKTRRSGIAEMKNDLKKTSALRSSKW